MEENKVLFQVISEENGTAVNCRISNQKEAFQVALAIHQAIEGSPLVSIMLATIIEMKKNDPDFVKALDEATIDMPDLESILKNTK